MTIRIGLVALALLLVPTGALGAIDLSIRSTDVIYTYAAFNAAGNPIPNEIVPTLPYTVDNGTAAYWTATTTFPEPAAGEKLYITQFRPDDRAVMLLNGVQVEAFGGLGPGLGSFVFTPGGPETPQYFQNNAASPEAAARSTSPSRAPSFQERTPWNLSSTTPTRESMAISKTSGQAGCRFRE